MNQLNSIQDDRDPKGDKPDEVVELFVRAGETLEKAKLLAEEARGDSSNSCIKCGITHDADPSHCL